MSNLGLEWTNLTLENMVKLRLSNSRCFIYLYDLYVVLLFSSCQIVVLVFQVVFDVVKVIPLKHKNLHNEVTVTFS